MRDENGGPAFPLLAEQTNDGWPHTGMTLRDYFAAKAMQALAANQAWSEESIAEAAYRQADAMMKERTK